MSITKDRRDKFNEMISFMDAVDSEIVNYALDFTGTILSNYCAEIANLVTKAASEEKDRATVSNLEMLAKLKEFALEEVKQIDRVVEEAKKRMN